MDKFRRETSALMLWRKLSSTLELTNVNSWRLIKL
uniref:Uncharacterized protein MANES_14G120100 n=1 Tax=Rhizophora mucronata TaxID=61149 RepID=A0A2P2MEP6_RHIMU